MLESHRKSTHVFPRSSSKRTVNVEEFWQMHHELESMACYNVTRYLKRTVKPLYSALSM